MSLITKLNPIEAARHNIGRSLQRLRDDWPLSETTLPAMFVSSILLTASSRGDDLGHPRIRLSMGGNIYSVVVERLVSGVLTRSFDGALFASMELGVGRYAGGSTTGAYLFHALFARMHIVLGDESNVRWNSCFEYAEPSQAPLVSLPKHIEASTETLICYAETAQRLPTPTSKDAEELKRAFEQWFHADVEVLRLEA